MPSVGSVLRLLCCGAALWLLAACDDELARARHGVAFVQTSDSLPRAKLVMVGGYRIAGGQPVPLSSAVELDIFYTGTFKIVGNRSGSGTFARTAPIDFIGDTPPYYHGADFLVAGGDTFVVDRYRTGLCAFQPVARLFRKRLEGFTISRVDTQHYLIAGGSTEYVSAVDNVTHSSSGGDSTAETVTVYAESAPVNVVDSCAQPHSPPLSAVIPGTKLHLMAVERQWHTATEIPIAGDLWKVLIVGGNAKDKRAEIFDPTAFSSSPFRVLSSVPAVERFKHTATLVRVGNALKVVILGGQDAFGNAIGVAEVWDAATQQFTQLGATLLTPRWGHTTSYLKDGRLLIAGGQRNGEQILASTEIFDPATNTFSAGPPLNDARTAHAAIEAPIYLGVIITGGQGPGGKIVNSVESCGAGACQRMPLSAQ